MLLFVFAGWVDASLVEGGGWGSGSIADGRCGCVSAWRADCLCLSLLRRWSEDSDADSWSWSSASGSTSSESEAEAEEEEAEARWGLRGRLPNLCLCQLRFKLRNRLPRLPRFSRPLVMSTSTVNRFFLRGVGRGTGLYTWTVFIILQAAPP